LSPHVFAFFLKRYPLVPGVWFFFIFFVFNSTPPLCDDSLTSGGVDPPPLVFLSPCFFVVPPFFSTTACYFVAWRSGQQQFSPLNRGIPKCTNNHFHLPPITEFLCGHLSYPHRLVCPPDSPFSRFSVLPPARNPYANTRTTKPHRKIQHLSPPTKTTVKLKKTPKQKTPQPTVLPAAKHIHQVATVQCVPPLSIVPLPFALPYSPFFFVATQFFFPPPYHT